MITITIETRMQVNAFCNKIFKKKHTKGYTDLKNILCYYLQDYKQRQVFRPIKLTTMYKVFQIPITYTGYTKNLKVVLKELYPTETLNTAIMDLVEKLAINASPNLVIEEDDF